MRPPKMSRRWTGAPLDHGITLIIVLLLLRRR
jgi:hypothetical protein